MEFPRGLAGNISLSGFEAIHSFYSKAYEAIPTFKVDVVKITGPSPDFTVCEMRCEGDVAVDMPHMGLKSGDKLKLVGVSLFWWRWEGGPEGWNGSLDEQSVRGWKIIAERAYHLPIPG